MKNYRPLIIVSVLLILSLSFNAYCIFSRGGLTKELENTLELKTQEINTIKEKLTTREKKIRELLENTPENTNFESIQNITIEKVYKKYPHIDELIETDSLMYYWTKIVRENRKR